VALTRVALDVVSYANVPARMTSRLKAVLVRLALLAFGTTLALAVSEIGVRLYVRMQARSLVPKGYVRSDVPGIQYLPGTNMKLVSGRPFSNNLGLINASDTAPQKPSGTFRILVVGDSVAQVVMDMDTGDPNFHEALFTSRLERLLRATTGRDVEVLNLSATGLSLAQELLLVQARGLPLDPDVILFAYCYNDPVETPVWDMANEPITFPALVWLATWLYDGHAERLREGDWYQSGPTYERLEQKFAELGALGGTRKVAVIGLPMLWNDAAQQIHLPKVEELTARNRLPYIDLWACLRASEPERWVSRDIPRDHIHYTAPVHRLVAEMLASIVTPIVTEGAWPPASRPATCPAS
jgi:lysophospholipase L1-like esterase